jgi:hypothetical protein
VKRMLRYRPSPAFVLAFIALSVALGGTATALRGHDTVSKDDIRRGAVGKSEVRTDSIGKAELIEDVITGGQVAESTLQGVATASGLTHFAVVDDNGVRSRSRNVSTTARTGEGSYNVVFNRDVSKCAYLVSLGRVLLGGSQRGEISTTLLAGLNNVVRVRTRDSDGSPSDREFHIAVVC